MTNEEIWAMVIKTITTSDGGLMNQQQLDAFITTGVKESEFLSEIGIERNIATSKKLDNLGVSSRILRPGVEATAPTEDVGLNLGNRVLTPERIKIIIPLSYDWLESAVGGQPGTFNPDIKSELEAKVQNEVAIQYMNDLVDLFFNGDKDAADPTPDYAFLKCLDGVILKMDEDDDVTKSTFTDNDDMYNVFEAMLNVLPTKYQNRVKDLRFLVNPKDRRRYKKEEGVRETDKGDEMRYKDFPVYNNDILVRSIFAIPEGTVILTMVKNFVMGFGREMLVERDKEIKEQVINIVMSGKNDVNYKLSEAVVKYKRT